MVAGALSRKSMGSLAHISVHKRSIVKELRDYLIWEYSLKLQSPRD